MWWTLLVGPAVLIYLWELVRPVQKPVNGIYRLPGRWYWLKRWIFLCIFKWRRLNNRKASRKTLTDQDSGYGAGVTDPERLEEALPLLHIPFAIDSVYFGGFSAQGDFAAIRIARRHDRTAEVWLYLQIPGIGPLHHPVHPDTLVANANQSSYSAGGLKIEMIEPMMKWKVSYNGFLRKGICKEFDVQDETFLYTKFSFIWKAMSDPFNFDTDLDPGTLADGMAKEIWTADFFRRLQSKHQTHYEQWGEMSGSLEVQGFEGRKMKLKTLRDHSFGVRDWRSIYRYVIHFIFTEDGTMIQLGVVSIPQNMSHLKVGYVMFASGKIVPVDNTDIKLWKIAPEEGPLNHYSFNFTAGIFKFNVEVEGKTTPEFYHHSDRGSHIFEKCCTFKINGKSGYGITEFHYRSHECESYTPPISLPLLSEPDLTQDYQTTLTLAFSDPACSCCKLVGGKASQLSLLTTIHEKVGFSITTGFSVTLAAYHLQLKENPTVDAAIEKIINSARSGSASDLQTVCSETVELIACTRVCSDVKHAIERELQKLFGKSYMEKYYAIRSSASGEDGSEASSAGQMETFLGVFGINQVLESVCKCWASAYTYLAVIYRRQNGQPIRVPVGVVIQEMVKSDVSGVLFTNHPVTGSSGHMTIDASYGLGEVVVSGKTTPDCITIVRDYKDNLTIAEKRIGQKQLQLYVQAGGGVIENCTTEMKECCIKDDQILQLCDVSIKLEYYFGSARDVEWALADGIVYILQARPITTLETASDEDLIHEFDDPLITDREWMTTANIGEMMPGAITPLTHSVFAKCIDYAVMNVLNSMHGVPRWIHPFRLLISCRGHLFINAMVPDVAGVNNIFGQKEMAELNLFGETKDEITVEQLVAYNGSLDGFLTRLWTCLKFVIGESPRQESICERWYDKVDSYTISDHPADSLELYNDICSKLSDYYEVWTSGLVKSANSGTWASAAIGVICQGKAEYTPEICSDIALLLSKCDNVYSAEVPSAVQELAKQIVKDNIKEKFLSSDDKECEKILSSESHHDLNKLYTLFMKRHGHRYVREAEFFEKSWKAQPEKLVRVIKGILQNNAYEQKRQEILSCADAISQMKTSLKWRAKLALKWLLPKARRAVGQREFGKSLCVKVSDKFKEAYWKLADLLEEEGRIPDKELMFFLTHREIGHFIKTRSPKLILRASRRKKLLPSLMKQKFPKYSQGLPAPIREETFVLNRKKAFSLTGRLP